MFALLALAFIAVVSVTMIGIADDSDAGSTFRVGAIKYETTSDNDVKVIKDGAYFGTIEIPSSVNYRGRTYNVTSIDDKAFYERKSLTSVTIGNSVTSIGYCAFAGCKDLTSVTIGNSVKSIGGYAFYFCIALTSVTIGNSVTSIGDSAFMRCTSLASVTIPYSVTSIGGQAFYQCTSLVSMTIPERVTSLGNGAFYGCTSLTSVTIGNSVTSIGYSVFYDCSRLTSVTIGNSVTTFDSNAFYGCTSMTSVTIPERVTSIGYEAFEGCTSLNKIIFNAINCSDIDSLAGVFGDAGKSGAGIKVIFSDGVTKIPAYLFWVSDSSHAPKIVSVTIPDSVKSIGKKAFYNCTFYDFDGKTEIKDYANLPGYRYLGESPSKLIRHALQNVSFDENGGSVWIEDMNVNEGVEFILPGYAGEMTGYDFVGWSYGDNVYSAGQKIVKENGNMTFTAVWVPTQNSESSDNVPITVCLVLIIAIAVFLIIRRNS